MDAIIVGVGIVLLAWLWAWSNRPEAPKPEEQPQEAIVEGLGVIATVVIVAAVCLLVALLG